MKISDFNSKTWSYVVLVLCVLFTYGAALASPPEAPDPPVGAALKGLQFFEGWKNPHKLGAPVNTVGWEDSAIISYDGATLYFAYTPLDYYAFTRGNHVEVGPSGPPERPGQHGFYFDIYEARIQNSIWVIENSSANAGDKHEAAIGIHGDESVMVFVRFDPDGEIYLTERQHDSSWSTPQPIVSVNTQCVEDNPHLSADGRTLYFDSNRSDINGSACLDETAGLQRSIYVSKLVGSQWSTPSKIQGLPNTGAYAWQIFETPDGQHIYWSALNNDGASCLFRARKLSEGSYGEKTLIARATTISPTPGDVMAVGEMSITGDGRFLYFVYMQYNSATELELGLAVAYKQSKAIVPQLYNLIFD
ncbi:MAG: PD40 domain-containing protein [Deltaproteobacteria bacterium]|jgi:hypothetical protein|nr:PD40 domain-containing protein [Deltaproteobacteria bacterium]